MCATERGEGRGGPDHGPDQRLEAVHDSSGGEELQVCAQLTEPGGGEVADGGEGESDGANQEDEDVPAENEQSKPERDMGGNGERKINGGEQDLVGDGVEGGSETGLPTEPAGQESVEEVGESGDPAEGERGHEFFLKDGVSDDGGHQEAKNGESGGYVTHYLGD